MLLAINSSLHVTVLPSPDDLEVIAVSVSLSSPIVVCVIYIPPSPSNHYLSLMLTYLSGILGSSSTPTVVMGDFNCPDIDWDTLAGLSHFSSLLCDLIFDLNLSQFVDIPTHDKGNILDLIIANSNVLVSNVHTDGNKFLSSDHFLLHFSLNPHLPYHMPNVISGHPMYFNYSKADLEGMCHYLLDIDFSNFLLSSDIESLWCELKIIIHDAISLFVPSLPIRRHPHPPWFNPHIRHSINILRSLRRRKKCSLSANLLNKISRLESQLQLEISSAKEQFESDLVTSNASNVFKYIRSITGSDRLPPVLFLDNERADSDFNKAITSSTLFILPHLLSLISPINHPHSWIPLLFFHLRSSKL